MLSKSFLASLALAGGAAAATVSSRLPLRIVSYNIRQAVSVAGTGEELWSVRSPLLVNQVQEIAAGAPEGGATIIGMQEVVHVQLTDIKAGLGENWDHIGVAREDGFESGEYSPIIYQTDVLKLLYNETTWLSETPDIPSKGWDAAYTRISTIGVFEHIETGKRWIAANTHLDNEGVVARAEGVKLVTARVKALQETWGPLGVSLTGDFNSPPGGEAYEALSTGSYFEELYNMNACVKEGPYETYTGFTPTTNQTRIDFIWLGPKNETRWKVDKYAVLDNIEHGIYISDHRAVVGDVRLRA
ncbi:hypothetical protein jhhlp_000331 [Lomentospora prolificans]|uniref:Endonuclease/exonuclease/phosphatase domain-containing protein n=1 Tax=Lomentospora prolificans TaxID=41688 RepID=A0A2N3NKN2_9PEZI|nr:hypothetical protein jhhlp_000331 [Lomentospora prolificans]